MNNHPLTRHLEQSIDSIGLEATIRHLVRALDRIIVRDTGSDADEWVGAAMRDLDRLMIVSNSVECDSYGIGGGDDDA